MDVNAQVTALSGDEFLRQDERTGLEALFERAFHERPISSEGRRALLGARVASENGSSASDRAGSRRVPPLGVLLPRTPPVATSPPALPATSPPSSRDAAVEPSSEEFGPADRPRYLVMYRGESGIGKSRIFRHLRRLARQRGVAVYEIVHRDVEGDPLRPFARAIRQVLRDHDPGAVLKEKYRYGLEGLVPELYAPPGGETAAGSTTIAAASPNVESADPLRPNGSSRRDESRKIAIFDAVTQLFLELAGRRPLLLLVHDLHWSDLPTIELLGYVGRNLAIRNTQPSPFTPRQLVTDPALREGSGTGPELDGFENDEWRALTRKRAVRLDLAQILAAPSGKGDGPSASIGAGTTSREADARSSGPRLMIVAGYRGFPEPTHYLETAIRQLGSAPFSYHGELRPLSVDDTAALVAATPAGTAEATSPELEEAVHAASEGFAAFEQELVRALLAGEGGPGTEGGRASWTAELVRSALAAHERSGAGPDAVPPDSSAASGPASGGEAVAVAPPPLRDQYPVGRRHAILRLRLAASSAAELSVLQLVSLAKRPIDASLVRDVLCGPRGPDPSSASCSSPPEIEAAIARLEARGIVERWRDPLSSDEGFFLRIWDYVLVVLETLDGPQRRDLHQRLGEALRGRLDSSGGPYEVYHHFRRGPDPGASLPFGFEAARTFERSFALEKARRVYSSLIGLLATPGDALRRCEILEQMARISVDMKEWLAAEDLLRRAQAETDPSIPVDRRVDWILLEAEAACATDKARGLKVLGKTSRVLKTEEGRPGVRLQLATARIRLARDDLKRAINFALKGITLCQKVGELPETGDLYRVLASAFYRKGEYTYAVDNYQRALDSFEKLGLKDSLVSTLDELGRVYLERGNYFRAARYFYRSLEIRRKQHDIVGLCSSYDELGQVYLRSGDYLKTIENLNRSLAFKERIGDFAGLNPTLVVLGDLYFRLGRYEQAIFYFERGVANSQSLGDTEGLVEAFKQLGRVYFEVGDIRQAERLCKQVNILASEFKLKSQEADGALLDGNLKSLARDWNAAERSLRSAAEIHGKLGHRRREVCAILNLAETKFERELYDESLKHASRAQIVADEVKALDLQVRALTLKGNIHRFLKGGNREKAREFLHKGLELSQGLSDVGPLYHLFYSLARVCHADREYAEASNFYGKAELILKQIGEGLSEGRGGKFFDDRRRKIFLEDLGRFRQESQARSSGVLADLRGTSVPTVGFKDRQITPSDYRNLLLRALRVHAELNQLGFHDRLLAEALELTAADRGFILRVQNRQYFPVAFRGFGKSPNQDPEFVSASALLQESIRKGRPWTSSSAEGDDRDREERPERRLQFGGLVHRSILAVPFMTDERIFGGLYIDKPSTVGPFTQNDQTLLDLFAQHAAVALNNRRELETAIREPITGYYTASYFTARLREAYRWYNLHGRAFTLVGFFLPMLEGALADGRSALSSTLADELSSALPSGASVCWASPILYVLLNESDRPAAEAIAEKARERLTRCFNEEVSFEVLPVHNRYQNGSEMYFEVRRRLLPDASDSKVAGELRALLDEGISLREAKRILEKHKIESTLRKTGGNITHAARELGIHRPQLSNLLKKYALKRDGSGADGQDAAGHGTEAEAEPGPESVTEELPADDDAEAEHENSP